MRDMNLQKEMFAEVQEGYENLWREQLLIDPKFKGLKAIHNLFSMEAFKCNGAGFNLDLQMDSGIIFSAELWEEKPMYFPP